MADHGIRGGNFAPIHIFLVISTCFLYLVAAGLFSKGVWYFESGAVSTMLFQLAALAEI